jgi:type II secretory pathway component GspD/PulD (secretin)
MFLAAVSVINYEQVGLTLKFKPIVFPNQDVQVTMEIESKDVVGASSLTPTFTERTIKGTARVQNNKTLLLASVAQGVESNGREGFAATWFIPVLGRLFSTPTKDNRQIDVVMRYTPKVIRAPAILPTDEVERPTGSLATPTSGSLEAMVIQEEVEEQLAAARRLPTVAMSNCPIKKWKQRRLIPKRVRRKRRFQPRIGCSRIKQRQRAKFRPIRNSNTNTLEAICVD